MTTYTLFSAVNAPQSVPSAGTFVGANSRQMFTLTLNNTSPSVLATAIAEILGSNDNVNFLPLTSIHLSGTGAQSGESTRREYFQYVSGYLRQISGPPGISATLVAVV